MRQFTDEELQDMTLEKAKTELSNRLYEAAGLIESLEHKRSSAGHKRITGNGHHIRQQIAAFGEDLLEKRWND